jgi:hypothetical protein
MTKKGFHFLVGVAILLWGALWFRYYEFNLGWRESNPLPELSEAQKEANEFAFIIIRAVGSVMAHALRAEEAL